MGKGKKAKRAAKALAQAEHGKTHAIARAHDHPVVDRLTSVSEIADQPPLAALAVVTLAAGLVLRQPTLARSGARMLLAHAFATGAKAVLKRSVDRSRPSRAIDDGHHHVAAAKDAKDTGLNSFPSGHTAGAVAVTQALAHELPAAALPARAAAGGIAALQLPRGNHYLSDTAAGAAIGWLAEKAAGVVIDAIEHAVARSRERRAFAEVEAHPS